MEVVLVGGETARIARAVLNNCGAVPLHITEQFAMTPLLARCRPSLLLLKNDAVLVEPIVFPEGTVVVFDGENPRTANCLRKSWGMAVDYGTSSHATVSLSSITDCGATVSLQRKLHTMIGTVLEPCEILVSLSTPMSPRQVLASVSLLLLTGIPWEKGYKF